MPQEDDSRDDDVNDIELINLKLNEKAEAQKTTISLTTTGGTEKPAILSSNNTQNISQIGRPHV